MRLLVPLVVGCSAPSSPAPVVVPHAPAAKHHVEEREPVDVIGALVAREPGTWISPGTAQLVQGGMTLAAPASDALVTAILIDDRGSDVRVGIVLEPVRFALWMPRARVLAIVTHDTAVSSHAGGDFVEHDPTSGAAIEARLRQGAAVRRLAHEREWTKVRYAGELEVEGWVPDAALADSVPRLGPRNTFVPASTTTLMVLPGSAIRPEPRWSSRELAIVSQAPWVETVRAIDDAWVEVSYSDDDVSAHGYLSKHDPPSRTHRAKDNEVPPPTITPNATVPDHACLYADEGGEPIGFVQGDRPAEVAPGTRPNWFSVALDTPWGAVAFAAHGADAASLRPCGASGP